MSLSYGRSKPTFKSYSDLLLLFLLAQVYALLILQLQVFSVPVRKITFIYSWKPCYQPGEPLSRDFLPRSPCHYMGEPLLVRAKKEGPLVAWVDLTSQNPVVELNHIPMDRSQDLFKNDRSAHSIPEIGATFLPGLNRCVLHSSLDWILFSISNRWSQLTEGCSISSSPLLNRWSQLTEELRYPA